MKSVQFTDVGPLLGVQEPVEGRRHEEKLLVVGGVSVKLGVVLVADDRHERQVFELDAVEKGVRRRLVRKQFERLRQEHNSD